MKNIMNLENVVTLWGSADESKRKAAFASLRGEDRKIDGPKVVKWGTAASELSITTRALRRAVKAAGMEPVKLPGRDRAYGIRAVDLLILSGGAA